MAPNSIKLQSQHQLRHNVSTRPRSRQHPNRNFKMVSFTTALFALASALVVSADYYIDPTSVPLATRQSWCNDELSTCPIICQQVPPGTTTTNTCDPKTLTYGCVCGNGLQPNVSEYSLTLPYHVCQQWGIQCVNACNGDNACQSACVQDHPCGAQNPAKVNATTSSTMSATASGATSTSSNQVFTGLAGQSTGTSSPSGNAAAPALAFGSAYGLVVVAGSLFAGFALML
ncbi:hypothetical protein QBC46DRAFT_362784 [Diplogelasinospora grovesii]|uniref:DUF7707 domain-containing protein n=1 Tax=Diplogelasinospora grovesii TaxID=303347 RepID=A0AAN6NAD1_9PEZI|nr:hypothetical protein QBC46DRAFT_362784 [Diplogelasinospora grovesii]